MKHKEQLPSISQRTGWALASGYSALIGAAAVGTYAHQTFETSPIETASVASTVGLMTLALCAGLYKHDRRRLPFAQTQKQFSSNTDRSQVDTGISA
jgi:hypothetical protein